MTENTLFFWFTTFESIPGADKQLLTGSKNVVGFLEEPEPKEIDKYNLREIGMGSLEDVTEYLLKEMVR